VGAALPSPFGYTGELTDPATGNQFTAPGTRARVPDIRDCGTDRTKAASCRGWLAPADRGASLRMR